MKAVEVRWLDSGMKIDHGWASREKYAENASLDRMEVVTLGYLMHEDDDVILVGQSYDAAHDTWNGAQLIAKRDVLTFRVLTPIVGLVEDVAA